MKWAAAGVEVELVRFADNFSNMVHAANAGDIDTWVHTCSVHSQEPGALLRFISRYVDGTLFMSFYSNDEHNEVIRKAFEAKGDELLQLLAQAERILAADAVSNPIGGYPGGALVSDEWRDTVVKEFTGPPSRVEFSNLQAD